MNELMDAYGNLSFFEWIVVFILHSLTAIIAIIIFIWLISGSLVRWRYAKPTYLDSPEDQNLEFMMAVQRYGLNHVIAGREYNPWPTTLEQSGWSFGRDLAGDLRPDSMYRFHEHHVHGMRFMYVIEEGAIYYRPLNLGGSWQKLYMHDYPSAREIGDAMFQDVRATWGVVN